MSYPATINLNDWNHWGQRTRVSPFPTIISMETMCKELAEYVGVTLTKLIVLFDDGVVHYLLYRDDRQVCAQKILARLKSDPLLYHRLVELQQSIGTRLVDVARNVSERVSPLISTQELTQLYQEYENAYRPVYASYGSVWIVEDALRDMLLLLVRQRIADEAQAIEALNVITLEPSAHVASAEQEALTKLALIICHTPAWREQFPTASIQELSGDVAIRIQQHLNTFFWVSRDYEDPVMTAQTLLERLDQLLKENPQEQYQQFLEKRALWQSRREQSLQLLCLPKEEISLVEAMHAIAQLKALRKRFVSESLYWFDPVLHEIARRLNRSLVQVRFMVLAEIEKELASGASPATMAQRMKQSAWHIDEHGGTPLVEAELQQIVALVLPPTESSWPLKGLGVSPGKARGPVKIILHPSEIETMQDGDVVVSIQIQPNFGTMLSRAAALICDGGHGITSHPATLAREAGIPAVIQTRNARTLLKNGDMVEVDGYAGTVTRVK